MTMESEIYTMKSFEAYIEPNPEGRDTYIVHLPVDEGEFAEAESEYAIRNEEAAKLTGATSRSEFEENGRPEESAEELRERLENGERVSIADGEDPLRSPSAGGLDKLEDGYYAFLKKDKSSPLDALHFCAGLGYPATKQEILDPKKTRSREISEEFLYVREKNGERRALIPSDREGEETHMYGRAMFDLGIGEVMDVHYEEGDDELVVCTYSSSEDGGESITGAVKWNPARNGINVLSVRRPGASSRGEEGISSEDIIDGDVNIYDGEGDLEGWNRNLYLVEKEALSEGLTRVDEDRGREVEVPAYRSQFGDESVREFDKIDLMIDRNTLKDSRDKDELLELQDKGVDHFVTTPPLRTILEAEGVFPDNK